jgi:phosphoglycolate phosphatase-like HAD superfamily hydrolase
MPIKSAPFAGLVEFRDGFAPRPRLSHAVFDFDGTLSWLRHGWPELMCQLFLPFYPLRPDESAEVARGELLAEILSGNGRPSIFQMKQFVERVKARDSEAPAPEELLRQYQSRLDQIIAERSEMILRRASQADEFVVFGARGMLELLQQRGFKLFVLSGTLEERVKDEANLLDLARFFGGRIFGSPPDSARFSKRAVLDKILAEENIRGENLLCLGDGPVEILHARELGGLAVAVASDEDHNGSGRMDPVKRAQLSKAGAHVLIPDYRDAAALLDTLLHG